MFRLDTLNPQFSEKVMKLSENKAQIVRFVQKICTKFKQPVH